MLWKMQRFTLQSMGSMNHKFPIHAARNVQTHLKSTVQDHEIREVISVFVSEIDPYPTGILYIFAFLDK